LDRNGDGVVTRAEWQGPDGAFRLHDTNKDGQLFGTEVFDARDRGRRADQNFDDWTPRGFSELDRNGDNRLTRREWQFNRESFDLADRNKRQHRDPLRVSECGKAGRQSVRRGALPRFRREQRRPDPSATNGTTLMSHSELDRNRDNRISREEFRAFRAWPAPAGRFPIETTTGLTTTPTEAIPTWRLRARLVRGKSGWP
jgi:hypothetical protein